MLAAPDQATPPDSRAMFAIAFFLVCLIIAPQLWIPGFVGLPTDFIGYPLLFISAGVSGRLVKWVGFGIHEWFMFGFVAWTVISALFNGFGENRIPFLIF